MEWYYIRIVSFFDYHDIHWISSECNCHFGYADFVFYYLYGIKLSWHDDEFYGEFFSDSFVWYGYRYGDSIHRILTRKYEKVI